MSGLEDLFQRYRNKPVVDYDSFPSAFMDLLPLGICVPGEDLTATKQEMVTSELYNRSFYYHLELSDSSKMWFHYELLQDVNADCVFMLRLWSCINLRSDTFIVNSKVTTPTQFDQHFSTFHNWINDSETFKVLL